MTKLLTALLFTIVLILLSSSTSYAKAVKKERVQKNLVVCEEGTDIELASNNFNKHMDGLSYLNYKVVGFQVTTVLNGYKRISTICQTIEYKD